MMDEVSFSQVVEIAFNEDCAEEPFEPLTGGKELQDLSIEKGGPSCTLDALVEYVKQPRVAQGQDRIVELLEQLLKQLKEGTMTLEQGRTLIGSGDLSAMCEFFGFEACQMCGLCSKKAVEIIDSPVTSLIILHHAVAEEGKPRSHTLRLLSHFARDSSQTVFLSEMVNSSPKQVDGTFGLWRRMHHFLRDIKITALHAIFIGEFFFLNHGERLPVAATNTALKCLPIEDLRRLHDAVELTPLPHPLYCIISRNLGGWTGFFKLTAVPKAVSRPREPSAAWEAFNVLKPDLANKAQHYAGSVTAKQQEDLHTALGVGSSTGAAASILQELHSKSQGGGGSSFGFKKR